MAQDISPKGNHLPSLEQLSALAKGRVPQNTVMHTEKWCTKGGEHVNFCFPISDTPDGIIFKKGQQKNDQED
ncbi:hypothetical protein RclHR1_15830003 [Rhizophagus clarus]|uniref:Uncharacterized protein n=1 Tax=Rhizophagus clarus TaxID=94130 RepID=A0A2Z6QG79_9GLOM|nr:hypothetical protein RclHR1_15830003 [Rhizophagus clarus]